MKFLRFANPAIRLLLIAMLLMVPGSFYSTGLPQSPPHISVSGSLSANRTQRGRTVQASVVMDIPAGYHVNSNKPLEKFLIPTSLKIEAPNGIRVGRVNYPRAVLRTFKFSKNRVSVYEGRATVRFKITAPKSFNSGSAEVKVRLRYQSCDDEVCFPPQTREVSLWLNVE
jgi:DsbC/DsbD-like thiol-disulfide interchange protein